MDFLQWWQRTDYAAKATVIGTGIAALALILTFLSGMTSSGDVIAPDCSSVNTGSIEGAEIDVTC